MSHEDRIESVLNGDAFRESFEESVNPDIQAEVGQLLADYLTDNFPQLFPWRSFLPSAIETCLSKRGTIDEVAALGEVFGLGQSWPSFVIAGRRALEAEYEASVGV